jgi:hypothetical protein
MIVKGFTPEKGAKGFVIMNGGPSGRRGTGVRLLVAGIMGETC